LDNAPGVSQHRHKCAGCYALDDWKMCAGHEPLFLVMNALIVQRPASLLSENAKS
jgi:hypothetical protein